MPLIISAIPVLPYGNMHGFLSNKEFPHCSYSFNLF